ncbi:hypothetical protein [Microbacterium abyssi]|uniref:hypothetical protein n=1 Tax=Microbacterium abyssi TaxID=2782166 RepID=UPI00188825DC|nr:hypothetical protein [Microbacterium sp. A18JL241]
MQEFWQWAGNFWWLIFPIMGMAGGAAKAWEQGAKRRHERRLETLRLKGELKAAQLAARGQALPAKAKAQDVASDSQLSSKELLERLFAEHDEITARWLDYELDVAKLIAFPAMSDGRQPLTAAFLRAKKTADTLRPSSVNAKISEQQVSEYLDAVGNTAVAFEIAEKEARRLRNSTFSEAERKKLDRAQKLLKVAVDDSATQAERNVAYKRVREELDGLIVLSDQAVEVLEKQVAREITGPATPPVPAPAPAPEPERMPQKRQD